jgi:hypothetical protein
LTTRKENHDGVTHVCHCQRPPCGKVSGAGHSAPEGGWEAREEAVFKVSVGLRSNRGFIAQRTCDEAEVLRSMNRPIHRNESEKKIRRFIPVEMTGWLNVCCGVGGAQR